MVTGIISKYNISLKSGSDCEVIGSLYLKFGTDFITELNSEFAFCIFDINRETNNVKIILSRDQNGIRPLYYSNTENYIMGSSILNGMLLNETVVQFPPRYYSVYDKITDTIKFTEYLNYNSITTGKIIGLRSVRWNRNKPMSSRSMSLA